MRILILKPQKLCYGIVEAFADNFGRQLLKSGIEVVFFDLKNETAECLAELVRKPYDAVVEFYSGLLSVKEAGGGYLWNCIDAPVYQICVDYPIYIADIMQAKLHRYYALCSDRNYCSVIRDCMPNISEAFFFPMPGREGKNKIPWRERSHEIVFVGSYENYRDSLVELNRQEENVRKIGYAFFVTMRSHTGLDQKKAFEMALSSLSINLSQDEVYKWLKMIGQIARAAVFYQREQMIKTILDAGYSIEVYGDSWKASMLAEYPNLVMHEQLSEDEYISVLEDAKISLNISYCSKAGFTERYSYTMLNGAVCVSDESDLLCSEFDDKEDIIFYHLDNINELPAKIEWVLRHPEKAQEITEKAYKKVREKYTWEMRVRQFLEILDMYNNEI